MNYYNDNLEECEHERVIKDEKGNEFCLCCFHVVKKSDGQPEKSA